MMPVIPSMALASWAQRSKSFCGKISLDLMRPVMIIAVGPMLSLFRTLFGLAVLKLLSLPGFLQNSAALLSRLILYHVIAFYTVCCFSDQMEDLHFSPNKLSIISHNQSQLASDYFAVLAQQ